MPHSLIQKLRIRENGQLLTINAPADFSKRLSEVPKGVKITELGKERPSGYQQVHWFVMNQKQMGKEMSRVMKLLRDDVIVWVYYPKGSSGLQTDLTRDKGWDCIMAEQDKLTFINLISFDDTWSAFGLRAKTDADRKKESEPREREIFKWVDPVTKTVTLPDDLVSALKKYRKEGEVFHSLAFSHKKEYIEWIVSAKKEETRKSRIEGTIERLGRGWKNPRNI